MLKFSFMSCVAPGWNFDRLVEVAVELNYQGIELRVGARQNHGIEAGTSSSVLKNYRDKLARSNLAASCLATSVLYSPLTAAQNRLEIDEQIAALSQLGAELGAPLLRVSAKSFNDEAELATLAQDL